MAFMREIDNSYIPQNAATPSDILKEKKARVNHVTIEGTMPNKANSTVAAKEVSEDENNVNIKVPTHGYYNEQSIIAIEKDKILSDCPITTVWTESPVDMKKHFPTTWEKLTADDFIVGSTGSGMSISYNVYDRIGNGGKTLSNTFKVGYDNETGELTFSGTKKSARIAESVDSSGNTWWINGGTTLTGVFCAWKGTFSG